MELDFDFFRRFLLRSVFCLFAPVRGLRGNRRLRCPTPQGNENTWQPRRIMEALEDNLPGQRPLSFGVLIVVMLPRRDPSGKQPLTPRPKKAKEEE